MAYQQRHAALLQPLLPQLGDVVAGDMQGLLTGVVAGCLAAGHVKVRAAGPGCLALIASAPRPPTQPRSPALPSPQDDSVSIGREGGGGSGGGGSGRATAPAPAQGEPSTALLLLLAKLCLFLEATTVPSVMEVLALHFPGQSADGPPPFVAGEVARRAGTAAQLLLGAYVSTHGRALSEAVEATTAATDWLGAPEPR
jgi:hypothetical protein